MGSDQKQSEQVILNRVKLIYNSFPQGEIEATEAPDFLVRTPTGTVGIEVTQYTHEMVNSGENAIQAEAIPWKITKLAQRRFGEKHPEESLWVTVMWSPIAVLPNKTGIPKHVEDLVEVVENSYRNSAHKSSLKWNDLRAYGLQNQYVDITIRRLPEGSKSVWGPVHAAFIPEPSLSTLQDIIHAKESKLPTYQERCDEVWLIINAGGFLSTSVDTDYIEEEEYLIDTTFNEVLLYDGPANKVFSLKKTS